MNRRVDLLIADLEGTLLRSDGTLSAGAIAAVAAAQDAGIQVVIASGRPPRSIRPIHKQLGLTTPVIATNGAVVYDYERGPLYENPLSHALASLAASVTRSHSPEANRYLECGDRWFADVLTPHLTEQTSSGRLGLYPDTDRDVDAVLADEEMAVHAYLAILPRRLAGRVAAAVRQAAPGRFAVGKYRKLPGEPVAFEVEFRARGCDKADAARALRRHLGVTEARTAAIGDGENDVRLLRSVGLSFAMGHAPRVVRRAATMLTASNDDDGVAEAIFSHLLEN